MRAGLAREIAKRGEHGMRILKSRFLVAQRAFRLDHVADFGRHDEIGAGIARAAHELARGANIRLDLAAGVELDTGRLENGHGLMPSSGSSLPARSSAARSS